MEPKPGVKTSELYVALAVAVAGLLMTYGVLTAEQAESWITVAEALIGVFIALVPTVTYLVSRYKLKKQ